MICTHKSMRFLKQMKVTRGVLVKSAQVSLVVGVTLVLINHGGIFLGDTVTTNRLVQILLCFLVPFSVSLYSQIAAIGKDRTDKGQPSRENISRR